MTKARDLASAAPAPSTVSSTEIGYLDGVSSAIQTQIDGKVASSLVDAKGDLLVGSADNTLARLAVGTNGHTLVADSSVSPTGLKWAAPAGGGKVLQVVAATESSWDSSATNTWIDNNLTATITPSATNSKVLVLVNLCGTGKANSDTWGEYRLLRGATTIITFEDRAGATSSTATSNVATSSTSFLDSPNTTSATTYKTQFRSGNNTNRAESGIASATSTIVLLEIGA